VDPVVALTKRLGAARWSQLTAMHVTDGDLRGAVRRGLVSSDRKGAYWLPGAADDVVLAARVGGRLTCASAARRHGVELLHLPEMPHVAVPRTRGTTTTEAVVHRVDSPGLTPMVPLLHAMVTLVRCLPALDAVVALDSAVRQRLVRVNALHCRLRGPGSVEARRRLGLVDGRSGSVIETVLRLALRQAGLPVDCQVLVPGVGRVDLVVAGWLVVEVDGFAFHSERKDYRNDRRRTNRLVQAGYTVLRFTYEDVMFRLPETLSAVQAVLAQGRI
jgi:very-short-patch-repair endonuclease